MVPSIAFVAQKQLSVGLAGSTGHTSNRLDRLLGIQLGLGSGSVPEESFRCHLLGTLKKARRGRGGVERVLLRRRVGRNGGRRGNARESITDAERGYSEMAGRILLYREVFYDEL